MVVSHQKQFVEEFGTFLGHEHSDACFYIYGSVHRGDHTPTSDVDGGIILDSGVVTDKKKLYAIAQGLALCLTNHRVELQLNVLDRQTAIDGRFLSYDSDFTDYIKVRENSRVVSGSDSRPDLRGIDYRAGVLVRAAFNLRCDRNNILLLEDRLATNPQRGRERVATALNHAGKFPKHIIWLRGEGEIVVDYEEMQRRLRRLLPTFDVCLLSKIRENKLKLEQGKLLEEDYFATHAEALECTEKLILAYLEEFPNQTKRECALVK